MRDRDLPNRCDDPSIMSSQPEPLPSTPRKKRPIFEAFARVTDSASKKGTRTPGAKRPRGAKLNFVDDEDNGEVFVPEATNELLLRPLDRLSISHALEVRRVRLL